MEDLTSNIAQSRVNARCSLRLSAQSHCAGGAGPLERIALDSQDDIFGDTIDGGDLTSLRRVIYEFTAQGAFDVLHAFCVNGNCSDGAWPIGGITLDSSGNVFGTTSQDGANSEGAVFELTQ